MICDCVLGSFVLARITKGSVSFENEAAISEASSSHTGKITCSRKSVETFEMEPWDWSAADRLRPITKRRGGRGI